MYTQWTIISFIAGWNSATYYNINEPWKHYQSEISQTQKEKLYDFYLWNSYQALTGGGTGELLFNRDRVYVVDEKVLEIENGNGCTTLWMY